MRRMSVKGRPRDLFFLSNQIQQDERQGEDDQEDQDIDIIGRDTFCKKHEVAHQKCENNTD